MKAAVRYPGLEKQPDGGRSSGRLTEAVRRFLRAQFGRPVGVWGDLAGKIMTYRPSNLDRIRWTISLLDVKASDRVLEIGFGPGLAIELVSRIVSRGLVVGVDHSEVMLRQARKRNASAIRDGRVVLRLGSTSNMPKFDEPFDKIFTVNSIHFWKEPIACLKELRNLMRPGGTIAVTLQPRSRSATNATTEEIGGQLARNLETAGFSQVKLNISHTKPVAVACALGTR